MRRDIFQAIADPTRREILEMLAVRKMTPNQVAEYFESSRQAVSKHLKILQECEALTGEKIGREIYYKINPAGIEEIERWTAKFRTMFEDRFNALDKILSGVNSKKIRKAGKYGIHNR